MMAVCPYCGSDIPDSAKFCTECGAPQGDSPGIKEPLSDLPEPESAASSSYQMPNRRPWDPEQSGRHGRGLRLVFGLILAILVGAALFLQFSGRSRYSDGGVSISGLPSQSSPVLEPGSSWHGTMEVSKHKGGDYTQEGIYEVWAYLDTVSSGDVYFEVYPTEDVDEDTEALLSMWVSPDGDRLLPLIGEEDAWVIDLWLEESDADAITFYLKKGQLVNDFSYDDGYESFLLSFRLDPEN